MCLVVNNQTKFGGQPILRSNQTIHPKSQTNILELRTQPRQSAAPNRLMRTNTRITTSHHCTAGVDHTNSKAMITQSEPCRHNRAVMTFSTRSMRRRATMQRPTKLTERILVLHFNLNWHFANGAICTPARNFAASFQITNWWPYRREITRSIILTCRGSP